MNTKESMELRSNERRRGGMVPAAAVLVVLGALGFFVASLYLSRPRHEALVTEQRDLVTHVTDLARSVQERVLHERATLAVAANIGSVLPEVLMQKSEEELEVPRELPVEPRLEGIAWNPRSPFAFINGNVLGIGDKIEGYTLTEIEKEKVVLVDASERCRELLLYDN